MSAAIETEHARSEPTADDLARREETVAAFRARCRQKTTPTLAEMADEVRRFPAKQRFNGAIDLIAVHVSSAWAAGRRIMLEDYVRALDAVVPELKELERLPASLVEAEFAARHAVSAFADHPPLADYRKRFATRPDVVAQLRRRCFGGERFVRIERVGEGAMGRVWRCWDTRLQRYVAIKEPQPTVSHDPAMLERIVGEARLTGRLDHPAIVAVYDLTTSADGMPYYVMPLIEGPTLSDRIRELHSPTQHPPGQRTRLLWNRLLGSFVTACDAVDFAHSRGVIHRDLKPHNIIVADPGRTMVVDWGLAAGASIGQVDSAEQAQNEDEFNGKHAVGTPEYMAPEQLWGTANASSDVFALGCVLYAILTGRPPYPLGESTNGPSARWRKVATTAFARPRSIDRNVPRALEAVCLKAMATKPHERYESANQLSEDVRRFLADERVEAYNEPVWSPVLRRLRRHRRFTGTLASVVVAAIVAIVTLWLRAERHASSEAAARRDADEATDDSQTNLYESRIREAHLQVDAGDFAQAHATLMRCNPTQRNWEWQFLHAQTHTDLQTMHVGTADAPWVYSLAFSPDGRLLATGSGVPQYDQVARQTRGRLAIWDWRKGRALFSTTELYSVTGTAFSPDGRWFAATDQDADPNARWAGPGSVHVWRVERTADGVRLTQHRVLLRQVEYPRDPLFNRESTLFGVMVGQNLRAYDVTTGALHTEIIGKEVFKNIRHSGVGQCLGNMCGDPVFAARIAELGFEIAGHRSRDGKLISGRAKVKRNVNIFRIGRDFEQSDHKPFLVLRGHEADVSYLEFTPDSRSLASAGGGDRTVRLWDLYRQLGRQEKYVFRGMPDSVYRLAFTPHGDYLAAGDWNGNVRVWSAERPPTHVVLETDGAWGAIEDFAVRPGNREIVGIRLGDANWLRGAQAAVGAVIRWRGEIVFWDAATGRVLRRKEIDLKEKEYQAAVRQAAFSHDGRLLAGVSAADHTIATLWDTASGNPLRSLRGHTEPIRNVSFSRRGDLIATAAWTHSGDGNFRADVRVWNTDSGQMLFRRNLPAVRVLRLRFSPDGDRLLVSGYRRQQPGRPDANPPFVGLWRIDSGESLPVTVSLPQAVGVEFVDGRTIVCGDFSTDEVSVVSIGGTNAKKLVPHAHVECLAVSKDSSRIAGLSRTGLAIWSRQTGQKLITLRNPARTADVPFNPVVRFAHDESFLAASGGRRAIHVWHTQFPRHPDCPVSAGTAQ